MIETFKAMIQTQGTDPWSQDSRTIGIRGLQEVNRTLLPIETIGNPVSIREGISWEETQKNFEEKAAHTSPENIDILLEFLANSTTEQDQQNAIVELTTLGKGKPKVIDRFLDLLPIHRQEKLDGLLVSGLFKIVTEDIPDDLKDKVAQVAVQELQLRDPEHPLKSLFGNIIGKIGRATPDMVESIARMVRTRESDWKSWLDSLVSMQPLGRQEVINLLNSSDDWQLLTSILSALERHGVGADDPAVVDGWIALTQRADPGIVSVGVFALERLGSGETRILEALERVVQSNDDEGVREMAVNALANLRSRGVN